MPKADGFMLSGSWSFASGIKHGTHIHTLGVIEGTGEARIFVLPVEKATLIDNWDVLGCAQREASTIGSIPSSCPRATRIPALTDTAKRGGGLYKIGVIGFAIMCHSAWACGIGRRVLDELAKNVRGKIGRAGTLADE